MNDSRWYVAAVLTFGVAGVLCAGPLAAQELKLHPYAYREGFESDGPALALWAENGPSTTAFSGPSEDRAFEGKKSCKLDIVLNDGTYHYFGVPVRVPCVGNVKLSARVWVAEGTTARVGFGANYVFPPTHHSGCGAEREFGGPKRKGNAR